jgi:hypothetical protein
MNVLHSARSRKSILSSNGIGNTNNGKVESESARRAAASINLYNDVPSFELSLDEFEIFAIKRLKVNDIYIYIYIYV